MENEIDLHGLIGQIAADALVRDATLIALMEVIPNFHLRVISKVEAAAPGVAFRLPEQSRNAFRIRLTDVRETLCDAVQPPDDAKGAPG